MTIVEFVLARIAEVEWWAREASRRDGDYVESGAHWQWVYTSDDRVAVIDPLVEEHVGFESDRDDYLLSLRSVEEFPSRSVGTLPQFALSYVEEVPTTVAGHIVRHDPARVLAECAAKRTIIDRVYLHPEEYNTEYRLGWNEGIDATVRIFAAVDADHPDYQKEWAL